MTNENPTPEIDPAAADAARREKRLAFGLLFSSLLVVGFGNTMLFALLPPLVREIGIKDAFIGWIFSLSALIWVFSSPFWGRVSDRKGRRPIVAMGLGAYGVSMLGLGLVAALGLTQWLPWVATFVLLVLARAVFGTFGSATSPAAQAYIADRTSPAERTGEMAALSSAFALGAAIGPGFCATFAAWVGKALAGPLGAEHAMQVGLLAPIFLTAMMAAGVAFAVLRYLPGGNAPAAGAARKSATAADSWRLARDPRLAPYLICGVTLSIVGGTLAQTFAFYTMDRLQVSGTQGAEYAGIGFMMGALATLVAQLGLLPRMTLSVRELMVWGVVLSILGVGVQIAATGLGALLIAQFLQGMGGGFARSGYSGGASLAVSSEEQGAAAGLVVAANGAGYVISPLTGAALYSTVGITAPLYLAIALLAAMGLFVLRSRRLRSTLVNPDGSTET